MRIKNIFIKETSDNLAVLERELNKPCANLISSEAVEMVIRTMHNIKGTAPMVGFNALPEIAMPIEQAYKFIQMDNVNFNPNLIEKTQTAVSVIQELLATNEAHTPQTKEEQRILIEFFNDINRLKAQAND